MPLQILDWPANPHCFGEQWIVQHQDQLAFLVAQILVGRARHAARVISGADGGPILASAGLKEHLRTQLILPAEAPPYHRDGMLFEAICWIAAHVTAAPEDLISDPHLQSTQQGMDMFKITIDPATAQLRSATIYEQKCTEHARRLFARDVLTAFGEYVEQTRDNQITQTALSLLARLNLTDEQERLIHTALIKQRPFVFNAGLTVAPEVFPEEQCVALFDGFSVVTPDIANRRGNTFPLDDVRGWFAGFAEDVWALIEEADDV